MRQAAQGCPAVRWLLALALPLLAAKLLAHQGCENGQMAADGTCCTLCPPGYGASIPCGSTNTVCEPCQEGVTFSSSANATEPCQPCSTCPSHLLLLEICTPIQDTLCGPRCPAGHYLAPGNRTQARGLCSPCRTCREGFGVIQACGPDTDTACQKCPEGYFSEVASASEPCLLCQQECGENEIMIQPCTSLSDTLCMDKELQILKHAAAGPWKESPRRKPPLLHSEGSASPNASAEFVSPPADDRKNIIPVYCSLLAAVVVGLLAYVAFKCWATCRQKHQLAKGRLGELGVCPEAEKLHGDSGVFLDTHSLQEHHPLSKVHKAEPRLYGSLSPAKQEAVEQMLEKPPLRGKDWHSLASHLGYEDETIETFGRGEAPAHTLLSDWAAREGATLDVLCMALAAIERGDVVENLQGPTEVSSMV